VNPYVAVRPMDIIVPAVDPIVAAHVAVLRVGAHRRRGHSTGIGPVQRVVVDVGVGRARRGTIGSRERNCGDSRRYQPWLATLNASGNGPPATAIHGMCVRRMPT
jgi:hypothetical protein